MFWLAVLASVGFTAWRLLANLKSLAASVTELNQRLAPGLEELSDATQETAELAERLQQRQADWQGRQGAARRKRGPRRKARR